jgi:hypothetical protein
VTTQSEDECHEADSVCGCECSSPGRGETGSDCITMAAQDRTKETSPRLHSERTHGKRSTDALRRDVDAICKPLMLPQARWSVLIA